MIKDKLLADPNVINAYVFGSKAYGSDDDESDDDFIAVVKNYVESDNINVHYFTISQFQELLNNCDIQMLECYFAKDRNILRKDYDFDFELNLQKLRVSISTITSNSWVKGKKKLIVTGDYDLRAGLKSIFHSLRILDYGIQIADCGHIYNWMSMNYVLTDLWKLSKSYERLELWNKIDEKYRSLYNSTSTRFKSLAPKDLSEKNMKMTIESILKKHNVYSENLLLELLSL